MIYERCVLIRAALCCSAVWALLPVRLLQMLRVTYGGRYEYALFIQTSIYSACKKTNWIRTGRPEGVILLSMLWNQRDCICDCPAVTALAFMKAFIRLWLPQLPALRQNNPPPPLSMFVPEEAWNLMSKELVLVYRSCSCPTCLCFNLLCFKSNVFLSLSWLFMTKSLWMS